LFDIDKYNVIGKDAKLKWTISYNWNDFYKMQLNNKNLAVL